MFCKWLVAFVAAYLISITTVEAQTSFGADDQPAATKWNELDIAERRALVARITDEQLRAIVLQQLDLAEARQPKRDVETATLIRDLEAEVDQLRHGLIAMFARFPDLPSPFIHVFRRLTEHRDPAFIGVIIGGFLALVLLGFAAEWVYRQLSAAVQRQILAAKPDRAGAKFGLLLLRLVLDLGAIALFALTVVGGFYLVYQGHEPVRLAVMTYLGVIVLFRVTRMVARFVIAPHSSSLRLIKLTDDAARKTYLIVSWLVGYMLVAGGTNSLIRLLGADQNVANLISFFTSLLLFVLLVVVIWRIRGSIAKMIGGDSAADRAEGRWRGALARTWHIFALVYLVLVWILAIAGRLGGYEGAGTAGITSLAVVVATPLAIAGLRRVTLLENVATSSEQKPSDADQEKSDIGEASAADSDERSAPVVFAPSPQRLATYRVGRVIIIAIAVMIFADVWGVDLFALSERRLGARISGALFDIGLAMLFAYGAWTVIRAVVDQRIAAETAPVAGEAGIEGGGAGASRLHTLLPLLKTFLFITLVVMTVMIVLSSLGVDIGPLIAGAGVIGLAIGFGAQTLVRDIVSGVFFLMDDAFRIGEYVDLGSVKGTVEKISIRSLRLRHHRGAVHTIPYGGIQHLTNYSRDWVMLKLEIKVPHETDIEQVRKIIKKIGLAIAEDPELGPNVLQPLKSQGVVRIEESALVVRLKVMTKPGEQFMVRREAYKRMQAAFAEHGIRFAHSRVIVDSSGDRPEKGGEGAAATAIGRPATGSTG